MSERDLARVNDWAGRLANGSAELIKSSGIEDAVVWVVDGSAVDLPLSIRNTKNEGFWGDGLEDYKLFQSLAKHARRQARYAMTDPSRDAMEQKKKLVKTDRSASSYSPAFDEELQPGYVVSTRSGLTVVAVAPNVDTKHMVDMVNTAMSDVENGRMPKMMEAARLLHAFYAILEPRLNVIESDRPSGIAMLALPYFIEELATDFEPGPVIVAAQSVGRIVDPGKFDVVSAKALCAADLGIPSGTQIGDEKLRRSNINGAVIAGFNRARRVVAVGGLKMEEDVEVLVAVEGGEVGKEMEMEIEREY